MSAHYFVYVIQNNIGRFYIGLSDGLEKRVTQHNNNESTWTRGKGPWLLVWSKGPMTLSEARKLERHLKQQKGGNGFFQATGLPRTSEKHS